MTLRLLLLTLIVIFVIDFSGFPDAIKRALGKWLRCRVERLKPFDCSLCMTWWCGLLAIVICRQITLCNIVVVALLALFADKIADVLRLVRDIISKGISKLYDIFEI